MAHIRCCTSVRLPQGPPGIQGIQGPVGPSGSATLPIGKCLFVNATTGDDSTALPYRFDKMYATITAAQTDAVAGDTIIIYPGSYTEGDLGKEGINYHFYIGAILTSPGYCFFANDNSFNVTGKGAFNAATTVFRNGVSTGIKTVNFECQSATSTGGWVFIVASGYTAVDYTILNVVCYGDIIHNPSGGAGDAALRVAGNSDFMGKMTVFCYGEITSNTALLVMRPGTDGATMNVTALRGLRMVFDAGNNWLGCLILGGTMTINSDIHFDFVGIYGPEYAFKLAGAANARLIINGNVTTSSVVLPLININGTTNNLICNGTINSAGYIYIQNGVTELNGDIITNTNPSSQCIYLENGTLLLNARVTNLNNTITGHVITKVGGTLVLNAILVTANAGAFSINATTNQDIKIYGALSNVNTGGGGLITNLITGTNLIVDTDVQ